MADDAAAVPAGSPLDALSKAGTLPTPQEEVSPDLEQPSTPASPESEAASAPATVEAAVEPKKKEATPASKNTKVVFTKSLALIFLSFNVLSALWLKADLDPQNKFFSVFGLESNLGVSFKSFEQQKQELKMQKSKLARDITGLHKRLEEKNYSLYTFVLNDIKSKQFQWFDAKDSDGNIAYGIIDAPGRMAQYFNSRKYRNAFLAGNDLSVNNIAANRRQLTFQVHSSNIFGKIFFMNTEFVEMMNAYPFLKEGQIKSFSREKDPQGNDSMSFNLRFSLQEPGETDEADLRFQDYKDWFLSLLPSAKQ